MISGSGKASCGVVLQKDNVKNGLKKTRHAKLNELRKDKEN